MELFHDKVPAQLVELAEKVYEQNPLFLADRYSVTSRAQPPATPITVDEGFLFLHSRLSDSKVRCTTKQKFHFLKRAAGEGENPFLGCNLISIFGL